MDVASFERAAQMVLGNDAVDPSMRSQAQQALIAMSMDLGCIPQLQAVLDGSSSSIAILAAGQALTKLVTDHWNTFKEGDRVQIREFAPLPPSCHCHGCWRPMPAPLGLPRPRPARRAIPARPSPPSHPPTHPPPTSPYLSSAQAPTCSTCWVRRAWAWSPGP